MTPKKARTLTMWPDLPRDGKKFRNAGEMLAWNLSRWHYRRRNGFQVSTNDAVATDRFLAMATLTRVNAAHAQAVLAMARRSVAESSYVNIRAMLEVWADFRLLSKDTSGATFQAAYLGGALALLRKKPDAKAEHKLSTRYGAAYTSAKARMVKNPFSHWTGKGRKRVVGDECGATYGDYYEFLSWDSHPVVQIVLDLQTINARAGKYQLGHRISQREVATNHCVMATHILRDMWRELVKQSAHVR